MEAQFELGEMYSDGLGVEKNIELAVNWFRKAAELGSFEAQETLKKLNIDRKE